MKRTKKTNPTSKTRAVLLKNIEEELRERIDNFLSSDDLNMGGGTIADRMFLLQVLQQMESYGNGEELTIASAFEICVRSQLCVVLTEAEYRGLRSNARKVLEMPVVASQVQ
jgi:hypothetical protein